jgi:hypothetical protein
MSPTASPSVVVGGDTWSVSGTTFQNTPSTSRPSTAPTRAGVAPPPVGRSPSSSGDGVSIGYDYIGGAIDDCIGLAGRLREGLIGMSSKFADQYESHVGKKEFLATASPSSDPELGWLTVLEWP